MAFTSEQEKEWLLEIKIINQHIISTMKKTTSNSRRSFLRNAATIAAGISIVPRHVLGKGFLAPSDQLTKGIKKFLFIQDAHFFRNLSQRSMLLHQLQLRLLCLCR